MSYSAILFLEGEIAIATIFPKLSNGFLISLTFLILLFFVLVLVLLFRLGSSYK